MNGALLRDAFDHHVWATLRVIDACLALPPDQLDATSPGTYGSIRRTIEHLVDSDAAYLAGLTGVRGSGLESAPATVADWRTEMARHGPRWRALLDAEVDPTAIVVRHRSDGSETRAPVGIRLAQAIHHGTDHRSHLCTILTILGVEPPDIDVWAFAESEGRLVDIPAVGAARASS